MTEYLISDELLTSIRRACYNAGKAGKEVFTAKAPSVEIVRCRDCKHHYTRNVRNWRGEIFDTDHFCELMLDGFGDGDNRVDPDHFCSWGKRREDA